MKTDSLAKKYGGKQKLEFLIEVSMENRAALSKKSTFWSNLFKAPAERSDLEELLLSIPSFENFNSNTLKHFLKIVHERVYTANEFVFYQGDPGIALYIVREGEIKIVKTSDTGNEVELARITRGDFFGELALIDSDTRSASAIAAKDSKLSVIFKPDLDRFIEKFPKKGIQVLRGLAKIIAIRLRILDDEYLALYNSIQENVNEEVGDE